MLYTYKESIALFGSHYALMKEVENKRIFKIKNGLYSTERKPKDLAVFVKEHKDAVFTLESAFFYLGISDTIPEDYSIVTDRNATKCKEADVKQYFENKNLVELGVISHQFNGTEIRVFNKERLLIELARYRDKIPYDYYKEIVKYYRDHLDDISICLVLEYLELFPKRKLIGRIIGTEIL